MLEYTDTHCHIHTAGSKRSNFTVGKWRDAGENNPSDILNSSVKSGVSRLVCVGTDVEDSIEAAGFVKDHKNAWASVGVHPHDAKLVTPEKLQKIRNLIEEDREKNLGPKKIVAIGEVGLDYYYQHSPKDLQITLLEQFLQMARDYDLPVIFHVREAFADFWPVFANFKPRGVLHSYTDNLKNLETALSQGLYIGLNGIITFIKDEAQLEMAKCVPLDSLLLETDSPYLTPIPFRGKICKPEHVVKTAEFLAPLRGEDLENLARRTTENACRLFNIK